MALNFYVLDERFGAEWWIPNPWRFLFPLAALGALFGCAPAGRPSEA